MNNERYEKYTKLKSCLKGVTYKNVPLELMSAFFIADLVYNYPSIKIFEKIKYLVKYLFLIPKIRKPDSKKQAIFGWSIDRDDYKNLSKAYKDKLAWEFENICLGGKIVGWRMSLNIAALNMAFHSLSSASKDLSGIEKFYIFLSIYSALNFYYYLEKTFSEINPEKYLSFNSSYQFESIMTLYFRYKGVETYSMQHGMYFEFKNRIPFEMITSYFCTAKNMLLWGEFSKQQIQKYVPENTNLIVIGNPLYSNYDSEKLDVYSVLSTKVIVGLPRGVYEKEVLKLLRVLESPLLSEYEFVVRPHPNLDKKKIVGFIKDNPNILLSSKRTLNEDIEESAYRAMIGFNSTVLFEGLTYKLPVLQYRSGNDEFYDVGFPEFSNSQQLLSLLSDVDNRKINLDFYFSKSANEPI